MHAFGEILKAHKKPQFSFIELDCDVFTLSPIGELILGYVSFELCEVFGSSSVVLNGVALYLLSGCRRRHLRSFEVRY